MKKTLLTSLIVGAAAGVVFFASGNDAQASEVNRVWTPRSVEAIKADIAKAKDNQYTIVWGDTLSGISQATNLTVQKLADLNKIANVDLIYAGNTLVFDGNVVTAKNDKGETVAQSVVTPQDKNDANKPVGKQEPAKQVEEKASGTTASSQSQNKQGTPATSGKTATSSQGKSAAVSGTNGSQTGTTSSTAGTKKPSETEQPQYIGVGNSGKIFDSEAAASEYGYAEINNENSPWYDMRFGANELLDSNYNNTGKWTVDFLENGFADE
ncbi:LysM domain-containing protein [Enterococcus faecium]|uniref:LysM peptidoglycan-binding domain-containing protein n=1 Tax=Enterococcus TaxID=1350 RepID=UPI0014754132|nr:MULTISPECIES: LysM domain-containing protein [Enterococcus]MDN6949206.1 LysM domain-containing protein [Enterococcus faecium]NME45763.1 LysM peptidoglycan-binding domain-containing protein [Enterococcus gallinarum]